MKFINLDLELVLIICKYLSSIDCKNLIFTNKKFSHELVLKSIKRQFIEIIINKNGTKFWYINGTLHREDGPAIEYANGTKKWCIHNKLHRENGPAIEYANRNKSWYINDKPHREDGPALEFVDGSKMWFINGKYLTEKEFNNYLKLNKK